MKFTTKATWRINTYLGVNRYRSGNTSWYNIRITSHHLVVNINRTKWAAEKEKGNVAQVSVVKRLLPQSSCNWDELAGGISWSPITPITSQCHVVHTPKERKIPMCSPAKKQTSQVPSDCLNLESLSKIDPATKDKASMEQQTHWQDNLPIGYFFR